MSKEYKTFHLWNSKNGNNIQIYPTYDFIAQNYNKNFHNRTIGGQLNTYSQENKGIRFTVPLTFVNSSDKSFINNLWYNQIESVFTLNLSSSPQSIVCRIINNTEPLPVRSSFQYDHFSGNLYLRSTKASDITSGTPFVLGDPVYGILNQNYNVLL